MNNTEIILRDMTLITLLQQLTGCEDMWVAAVAERGLQNPETARVAFRTAEQRSTTPEHLRKACRAALGIAEPGLCVAIPLALLQDA